MTRFQRGRNVAWAFIVDEEEVVVVASPPINGGTTILQEERVLTDHETRTRSRFLRGPGVGDRALVAFLRSQEIEVEGCKIL